VNPFTLWRSTARLNWFYDMVFGQSQQQQQQEQRPSGRLCCPSHAIAHYAWPCYPQRSAKASRWQLSPGVAARETSLSSPRTRGRSAWQMNYRSHEPQATTADSLTILPTPSRGGHALSIPLFCRFTRCRLAAFLSPLCISRRPLRRPL
jgi:hypothetical protein